MKNKAIIFESFLMTISFSTAKLQRIMKLIIAACAIATMIALHHLNAMEPETRKVDIKKIVASDEQLYQLLSAGIENDSQFYLPKELIQAITINAHTITEWHYYEEHGACLDNADDLITFIQNQARDQVDIKSTVNIIKACLNSSGKSLCTIYQKIDPEFDTYNYTALHVIARFPRRNLSIKYSDYCINALCLAAGNNMMDFLCAQDSVGLTALHHAAAFTHYNDIKTFITIAGDKAFELISIQDHTGRTALDIAESMKPRRETNFLNPLQFTIDLLKNYKNITSTNNPSTTKAIHENM
jgi:hypothetical protein